jgi:hypothetical protein
VLEGGLAEYYEKIVDESAGMNMGGPWNEDRSKSFEPINGSGAIDPLPRRAEGGRSFPRFKKGCNQSYGNIPSSRDEGTAGRLTSTDNSNYRGTKPKRPVRGALECPFRP